MRDYIPLPYLKDVQPEDIEDVSDRFVPLFAEERNADRVKRVNIRGANPFFLVSLIEHKTHVDYNVCMQIFRYMVYIWDAYVKEAEDLAGKVKEKKMGMLFENMQKMDIQEAWRKTAEQRMRAEKAEQKAEELTKKLEAGIRFLVESCRNDGLGQEDVRNKLVEIYQMDNAIAEEKMMQYWR